MANIFYNAQEGRLRAFWRLLLQGIIYIVGSGLFSILIGIGVGLWLALQGADIRNPQVIMAASNGLVVRVLGAVISLLIMLVSYWVAARWLDHRPFCAFGFRFSSNWWIDFGFGLLLGAVLMVFIFSVELAAGWIKVTGTMQSQTSGVSFWSGILAYMVVFFCVGIYEEMLSRGYQLRNLAEGLNFKPLNPRVALLLAYLISSSIFGLMHLGNPNASLISTVNIIVAGLFLGLGYMLTGELAISIGIHMTWNFFQGNVFGFPVSGLSIPASFVNIQQGGPELWTGGAFGPEAGLIGLSAMLLGSLLIWLWVRYHTGQAHMQDALAVYQKPQPAVAQVEPLPTYEAAPKAE